MVVGLIGFVYGLVRVVLLWGFILILVMTPLTLFLAWHYAIKYYYIFSDACQSKNLITAVSGNHTRVKYA